MSEVDLLRHPIRKVLVTGGCGFIGATGVRDLLDRTTGLPVSIEYRPARAEEIIRNYTSISKAQSLLGFRPCIEVERGVADCWDWFRARGCFHQGVGGTSV